MKERHQTLTSDLPRKTLSPAPECTLENTPGGNQLQQMVLGFGVRGSEASPTCKVGLRTK